MTCMTVPIFTYNKLEQNHNLADKTELLKNLSNFYHARGEDPFEKAFPLTFNIAEGSDQDQEFIRFKEAFK